MYLYRRYPFIFQVRAMICSSYSYHPVHTHIQIHVHICIHISICSQGKIQNHDTGDEHTTVLQSEQCIYMKGTKTVLSLQLYLNQLFHIFYIFLFPPRSASFSLFFFFVFVFIVYRRMTTYSPVLYLFTYPEWATAMVYVKSRRRLQFLSDQPWRCSQAFIVKLFCFAFVF